MEKYRKVKIKPLTELEELNLKKSSEKHYDVSELPAEAQKELWKKLMSIISKSDGAIVAKPIAGKQYVSALVKTTKKKGSIYSFAEPNPIHVYYKIAVGHLENTETAQHDFQKIHNNPEQEYEAFCHFFEEMVQGVVFLLMAVEGFINKLPAEGQTYQMDGTDKTKNDIEWMNVTDKLRIAIPVLTGNDIFVTNRPVYDRLQLLNDLRNDLIHLKNWNWQTLPIIKSYLKDY